MNVTIEFCRTRDSDQAQAVVGRESAVAAGLDEAIGLARRMAISLNMPQRPDAITIRDEAGEVLFSGAMDGDEGVNGQ